MGDVRIGLFAGVSAGLIVPHFELIEEMVVVGAIVFSLGVVVFLSGIIWKKFQ